MVAGMVVFGVIVLLAVGGTYLVTPGELVTIKGHVAIPSPDRTADNQSIGKPSARCDPFPCKPVPNTPVKIVRPGQSGWKAEADSLTATDENGDFTLYVGRNVLSSGPVFAAALDPSGEYPLMAALPSGLADAIDVSVDRTTTAAAVLHCPGGMDPPSPGSYCFSEFGNDETLESVIDRYFSDHPTASVDPTEYLPVVSSNARIQEEMGRILSVNGQLEGFKPITAKDANRLANMGPALVDANPLNIEGAELPRWKSGQWGSAKLEPTGGRLPYHCSLKKGYFLPKGFTLSDDCAISGKAPLLGSDTTKDISPPFTVVVKDSSNPPAALLLELSIVTVSGLPRLISSGPARCKTDAPCLVRIADAEGGVRPYTFQSDTFTNGAPPMGAIVDVSGFLKGITHKAGQYTFGVCVKDAVGSSDCGKSTVIIEGPAPIMTTTTQEYYLPTGELSVRLTSGSCSVVKGTVSGPVGSYLGVYYSNGGTPVSRINCGSWTPGPDRQYQCMRNDGDPQATGWAAVPGSGLVEATVYGAGLSGMQSDRANFKCL
ncbi:MAG: hypothetical protein V1875_09065 [Candidatus Altiarchaeota archaeon]